MIKETLMFHIMARFLQPNFTGSTYGVQSLNSVYENINKKKQIISKNKLYTRLKRYKKIGLLQNGHDWAGRGYCLTDKGELWFACKISYPRMCNQYKIAYKRKKKFIKKAVQSGEIYMSGVNSIDVFKMYTKR